MAIEDNVAAVRANATGAIPSQASASKQKLMSFMTIGNAGGLNRTPSSEGITKAMTALGEESKKLVEAPWAVTLLTVDIAKETNLAFSGIVLCARRTDNPRAGVVYHTLILEESGQMTPNRIETFRNVQFEVQKVTGDYYDPMYAATVEEIVKRAFPNTLCRSMNAQVIPRTFNYEDKEAVRALYINAQLPCNTILEMSSEDFRDMDLTAFKKDSTLAVRVGFNEPQSADYVGLPVRTDINIILSASSINTAPVEGQMNSQQRSNVISKVGGYIDPVWAPVEANVYQPNMPQPKFGARFIITQMENVAYTTLASQLLALASSLVLRENNNYFPYFSPRPIGAGGRNVDLRDIGAINIEANVFNDPSGFGPYIDTKANSFTPQDLGKLMVLAFRPGITYSLRVSECGPDTWFNDAFKAAGEGNPEAANAILRAANTLTGGAFERHYNSRENPVIVNYDRVHLGYYIGQDGAKHDLSDIDYLAIMNLVGRNDVTAGASWSDTFFKTDQPAALRLSARKKMIEAAVHSDITFTGFGRLVTFTGMFIESLAKACAEVGLDIRTVNPSNNGDFFSQRAGANFIGQSQVMPGSTGVFTQGYGTTQNGFQDPRGWNARNAW